MPKYTSDRFRKISRNEMRRELGLAKIVLDRNILQKIIEQARNYPDVEEGGVLVGHLDKFSRQMEIAGFIRCGPNARRTRGSLHCDLDFQEAVFDLAKAHDENLQHLGSWHGHHCNGAAHLSGGDLNSYYSMVDSPYHAHDYYFAILLLRLPKQMPVEKHIFDYFNFYIISRKSKEVVYLLDRDCLCFDDVRVQLQDAIREYEDQVLSEGIQPKPDGNDFDIILTGQFNFAGRVFQMFIAPIIGIFFKAKFFQHGNPVFRRSFQ